MMTAIADWKTEDEYPSGDHIAPSCWAWEFLRRNPDYQADWDSYRDAARAFVSDYDWGMTLSPEQLLKLGQQASLNHYEPPRQAGESVSVWLSRCGKGEETPLGIWLGQKWGIETIVPPTLDCLPMESGFTQHPYRAKEVYAGWFRSDGYPPTELDSAMAFDLAMPIEPQIEAARSYLTKKQRALVSTKVIDAPPTPRLMREKYTKYLRALDAESCQVSIADIGKVLLPEMSDVYPDYGASKNVRNWLAAAHRLRDEGYRLLPFVRWSPKKT